jgi:2-methylisocitrate lyase-like PEP mutase family enzyme
MTTILKQAISSAPGVLAPGVYDSFSALIAQQCGAQAVYLSGASIAYTRLGRSDVGLTTYTEVEQTLGRITDRVDVPVIVDGDTGFGNALNVARTIRGFEKAGAAMIQLEDQTFPKRCGHLSGKSVVPVPEMCGKLKAALDARRDDGTLILARTDSLAVEGIESAFERAHAYMECGVDALFIEALRSEDQLRLAAQTFGGRIPLLANMVEGGDTPLKSAGQLQAMGFRIVIFPGGAARAVAFCLQEFYSTLQRTGSTQPLRSRMLDFSQLNTLIGTPELLELGQRYDERASGDTGTVQNPVA